MKNTPYMNLASLCLVLILSFGALFGKADEQEVIDILDQKVHHEDSLKREALKDVELGSPRGQDISIKRATYIDTLVAKNTELPENTQPSERLSRIKVEENSAIEVYDTSVSEVKKRKSFGYLKIADWLGKLFMVLSGLLLVLGGVYLFGHHQKERKPENEEQAARLKEEQGIDDLESVKTISRSNAYERFVNNLKTDFEAGDIDKVIRQLLVLTKGTNTHDIVSMLENQWEELEAEYLADRLTKEFYLADVENIGKTLLALIDELEG